MNSDKLPGWLVVLLSVLAVVVLGPPAVVIVVAVLALAFSLGAAALGLLFSFGVALFKVSLVALGIAAAVMLLRAMFGSSHPKQQALPSRGESIETIAARLDAEEQHRREHLDRQLAEAMQSAP